MQSDIRKILQFIGQISHKTFTVNCIYWKNKGN